MDRTGEIINRMATKIIDIEKEIEAIRIASNPGIFTAINTVSALTNADERYGTIFVSSSLGAYTINLPTAVGIGGRIYIIKDNDGNANVNNITVTPFGAENIDGIGGYTINTNYGRLGIQSNGSNWRILFT